MSVFKKIIFWSFLIIILSFFLAPFNNVLAAYTIKTTRTQNIQDTSTGKWLWNFKIETTNIEPSSAKCITTLEDKDSNIISETTTEIIDNQAFYSTGSILDINTFYKVNFKIIRLTGPWKGSILTSGEFSETTGETPAFEEVTPAQPNVTEETETSYTPIAPIEGMTTPGCLDKNNEPCVETEPSQSNPCPFGHYLNMAIKIFLGLCAVLAMIMIIIGGIEYMTSDLASSKEAGKKTITNAILGLLLALGAFLILKTINPQLLDVCLNDLPKAKIVLEDEEENPAMAVTSSGTFSGGSTKICTEGYETIVAGNGSVKMYLCKRISQGVKNMINKAWAEGKQLSGGSFRSPQDQINLRAANCGQENIYNKKANCRPPTAYPGTSRHESGLAVDFTCKGVLIQTKDNECFLWLSNNAGPTLKNFKKEPWHWSFDGK